MSKVLTCLELVEIINMSKDRYMPASVSKTI